MIRVFPKIPMVNSLRTLLFSAVSLLVIVTGLLVSQIVIRNYSDTLLSGVKARAETIAARLAMDAADKILINDLVAVQKMLDDQLHSEPALLYLFVLNKEQVLVHTFPKQVPASLIQANTEDRNMVKLMSESHERFMDIQWPILDGKAGVLRLGISEAPHREKIRHLDRVHRQMLTTFSVSRQIAALPDLNRITAFLLTTFNDIVACQNLFFVILAHDQKKVFLAVAGKLNLLADEIFDVFHKTASRSGFPVFLTPADINALKLPDEMCSSSRMAVFPFYYHQQVLGAMLISCPNDCTCLKTEMEVIRLILEQASGAIFRALEHERQIQGLNVRTEQVSGYRGMVGKDPKIQVIYKLIQDVAPTDATVLIQGESGTGKEMVARALHEESPRSGHPFVLINCAAYPATLLESELFGHEKGAFTGAVERKIGKFEQAGGGTVFLDEIGEIPMSAQTMLLRVLQSKKIDRIDSEAMRLLVDYDWPGNIRELENSIEYAVTLAKSEAVFMNDLPAHLLQTAGPQPEKQSQVLQVSEKETICQMLDQCRWNKTAAAASLGISRSTLYEKIKKYAILPPAATNRR